MNRYSIKKIHISIDDVNNIFEDINANFEYYPSIFANKTLELLKYLHDKYDMKFNLYCFYSNMNNTFDLSMCTNKFRNEFIANKKWLSFSFHGLNGNTHLSDLTPLEYNDLLYNFTFHIERICGAKLSKTTRLHNYEMNKEQANILRKHNVNTLFISEQNIKKNYSLDETDVKKIKTYGSLKKDKMHYLNANQRIDNCKNEDLVINTKSKIHYIYFHEWTFYDNFDDIKKWLINLGEYSEINKYKFR